MNFHEKLDKLMEERNYSLRDLGMRVGTSATTVGRWLDVTKPTLPKMPMLLKLARHFHVPVEYLIDPDQVEPKRGPTAREEVILELVRGIGEERMIRRLAQWLKEVEDAVEDAAASPRRNPTPDPLPLRSGIEVGGRPVPAAPAPPRKAGGKSRP